MNEVETLYKNVGIKKYRLLDRDNKLKWVYPTFNAEKQLELIKWVIQKDFYDERIIRSNFEQTYFYCTYIDYYGDYCESEYFEKFEEALANVFNYFWQDLTPEEKQQIREILE